METEATITDRLELETLATAWLQFTSLADEMPGCRTRDALLFAACIADTLSNLRSAVSEVITHLDLKKYDTVDAARELRHALDEAAGGDSASSS